MIPGQPPRPRFRVFVHQYGGGAHEKLLIGPFSRGLVAKAGVAMTHATSMARETATATLTCVPNGPPAAMRTDGKTHPQDRRFGDSG